MRILSFITALLIISATGYSQSPHEDNLKYDCSYCHQVTDWKVILSKTEFKHNETGFKLIGQHIQVDCRSCHTQLKFSGTSGNCSDCHKDIHMNTVGFDCSRCHTPESWIVKDVNYIHSVSRFPLTGVHSRIDCAQCHRNFPEMNFSVQGVRCFECHQQDYLSTANPNHSSAGFSTECQECHSINSESWSAENFVHNFFPLVGGHKLANCFSCHNTNTFSGLSRECYSCHKKDYENADDPNHVLANFSHDCTQCHSINGWDDANFDHSLSGFQLTGAHINVNCSSCHQTGYTGTASDCISCHQEDYNLSSNPSHTALSIPTTCTDCHSTNPNWQPALFPMHNNYYVFEGAHLQIAANCTNCHNGNYTTTPNTCIGCHTDDYNRTNNPPHSSAGFPVECTQCHTQNSWSPSTFDHTPYFPIYSGSHQGKWTLCSECHTTAGNFSVFSCTDCHEHNRIEMDDKHSGISGYVYSSQQCFACHPTGEKSGSFNHNISNFPLTGAHLNVNCVQCHQSGYSGTPSVCSACHQNNFAASTNPNHQALGISTDCISCHSTNTGWKPALFPQHNLYFELTGAHLTIADNCASCHNGNYSSLSNLCKDCHQTDYNNAQNPNHQSAGISTTCSDCHTTTAWIPSSFDHASTGFQLTGQHNQIQCSSCHSGSTGGLDGACISCHQNDFNSAPDHVSLNYPQNCQMCHNSVSWTQTIFNHSSTAFPLTGGHIDVNCQSCHQSGFSGTTTVCVNCHQQNYNSSVNPSHTSLQLSINCTSCHTTNPDWKPALFPDHNNYYQLQGAHISLLNNCSGCHNGNYVSTPNTCFGCHQDDYNSALNPPHQSAGFPTECLSCHNQNSWSPSTFNHDALYFPIYSGRHQGVWNLCSDCHTNPNNFSVFSCINCHEHNITEMNQKHLGVSGYIYESNACLSCHPNGELRIIRRQGIEIR